MRVLDSTAAFRPSGSVKAPVLFVLNRASTDVYRNIATSANSRPENSEVKNLEKTPCSLPIAIAHQAISMFAYCCDLQSSAVQCQVYSLGPSQAWGKPSPATPLGGCDTAPREPFTCSHLADTLIQRDLQ